MIYAIIVAAGNGVRMQAARRKQYLHVGHRPILSHTLMVFDQCHRVDRMIVVVPDDDMDYCRKHVIEPAALHTDTQLVAGGVRRQDSVCNGLDAISAREGIVLIHDGVRPLVTEALIEACILGADEWGACIPALTPIDTPKQVKDEVVTHTIPRDSLRFAQTPQAFQLPLIRKAHHDPKLNTRSVTDDASLVEAMGEIVHVISGLKENIKITTQHDLGLAEHYFSNRLQDG